MSTQTKTTGGRKTTGARKTTRRKTSGRKTTTRRANPAPAATPEQLPDDIKNAFQIPGQGNQARPAEAAPATATAAPEAAPATAAPDDVPDVQPEDLTPGTPRTETVRVVLENRENVNGKPVGNYRFGRQDLRSSAYIGKTMFAPDLVLPLGTVIELTIHLPAGADRAFSKRGDYKVGVAPKPVTPEDVAKAQERADKARKAAEKAAERAQAAIDRARAQGIQLSGDKPTEGEPAATEGEPAAAAAS